MERSHPGSPRTLVIHEFSMIFPWRPSMISMSCLRSGKIKTCWPNCSLVFSLNPIQWHRFVGKWAIYTQSMAILIRKMRFLCFELFKHPWDFGVLPWFYHHFEVLNPQCWTKSQVWCSCRSVPPQCRDSPHRSARWSCWGPRPWKWNSWDLWKSHLFGLIFLFFLYEKNWSNKWENWSRLLWKDGGKRVEEIEILSSGTDLAS